MANQLLSAIPARPRKRRPSPRYPRTLALGAALTVGCAESSQSGLRFPEDDPLLIIPGCSAGRCADPYEPVYVKDELQIRARLRHCAGSRGSKQGKVQVRLEVGANGKATNIKVLPVNNVDPDVLDCFRSMLPSIPFQIIPGDRRFVKVVANVDRVEAVR